MSSGAGVVEAQGGAAPVSHKQKEPQGPDSVRSSNSEADTSASGVLKVDAVAGPPTSSAQRARAAAIGSQAAQASAAATASTASTADDKEASGQGSEGPGTASHDNDAAVNVASASDSAGARESMSASNSAVGEGIAHTTRHGDGDRVELGEGRSDGRETQHEEHSHPSAGGAVTGNEETHGEEQGAEGDSDHDDGHGDERQGGDADEDGAASGGEAGDGAAGGDRDANNGGEDGQDDEAGDEEGDDGDEDDEEEDEDEEENPSATVISGHMIQFSLQQVNPFLVCRLCAGYLINATTLSECLHTFCKSCIVDHFDRGHKACPVCGQIAHEINPHETLRQDRTIQSIVYKLVPGLLEEEERRVREFEAATGTAQRTAEDEHEASDTDDGHSAKRPKITVRKNDPQVSFMLEPEESHPRVSDTAKEDESAEEELDRPFIRTSSRATVMHLKKFLARKLGLSSPDDVDVLCRGEVLGKEYTLEYVLRTRWRKPSQLMLRYRPRIDIQTAS